MYPITYKESVSCNGWKKHALQYLNAFPMKITLLHKKFTFQYICVVSSLNFDQPFPCTCQDGTMPWNPKNRRPKPKIIVDHVHLKVLVSCLLPHILMPSPSMYYTRISSPRLEILPKGLEIIYDKTSPAFCCLLHCTSILKKCAAQESQVFDIDRKQKRLESLPNT